MAAPCLPNRSNAMAILSAGSFIAVRETPTFSKISWGELSLSSSTEIPRRSNASFASRTFSVLI